MKLKKFEMKELGATLYMGIGSFKELEYFSETVMEDKIDKDEFEDCRGLCIPNKRNVMCYIIEENTKSLDYKNVLLHEIVHGIHYILDHIGHGLSFDEGTEILAYYTAYYIEEGLHFLDELKKKTGQEKKRKKIKKKSKDKNAKSIQG